MSSEERLPWQKKRVQKIIGHVKAYPTSYHTAETLMGELEFSGDPARLMHLMTWAAEDPEVSFVSKTAPRVIAGSKPEHLHKAFESLIEHMAEEEGLGASNARLLLLHYFVNHPDVELDGPTARHEAAQYTASEFKVNVSLIQFVRATDQLVKNGDLELKKGKIHLANKWRL